MPNLLVFQHLETLYLGGNHVRVVCERVWRKSSKVCISRASRLVCSLQSPKQAHVWSMQGSWRVTLAVALQDKSPKLGRQLTRDLDPRLIQVARPSHQNTLFVRNLTLHIPYTPYYKYPYTHKMWKASKENFERETVEKNKIDSSTIFILWFSKFLYSHPLHWYILERYISQNPYLTISISVRRLFGAWETIRKGPINIGWCNGLLRDLVS